MKRARKSLGLLAEPMHTCRKTFWDICCKSVTGMPARILVCPCWQMWLHGARASFYALSPNAQTQTNAYALTQYVRCSFAHDKHLCAGSSLLMSHFPAAQAWCAAPAISLNALRGLMGSPTSFILKGQWSQFAKVRFVTALWSLTHVVRYFTEV